MKEIKFLIQDNKLFALNTLMALLFSLYLPTNLAGQQSNNFPKQKSFTIGFGASLSKEIGLFNSFELQGVRWGKLHLNSTYGVLIYPEGNVPILDISFGYGYPIVHKENSTLFIDAGINNIIHFYDNNWASTTFSKVDLDYRRRWDNYSLSISPFVLLNFHKPISMEHLFYTAGIKLGIYYHIPMKD